MSASLEVRPFIATDRVAWASFVERCPDATFFHRIEWRDIVEEVFAHRTHYLLIERGDELVGVLPLAEIKSRLFGHSLVSLPFAVYGGVATTDESARSLLHAAAVDLAHRLKVDHLELRNRASYEPKWSQQSLYTTFRKTITPDAQSNLQAIPGKQRAMVRKGAQLGLASEIDQDADRFFQLYADNVHRHGTPPFPKKYFASLLIAFGDACEIMTVVDSCGRPLSAALSFYFRDESLYYYAGDIPEARTLAANHFKCWELIRRAGERGCRVCDFGRSKAGTGTFDFKKNWGFTPEPLHYEYRLIGRDTVPQNNPSNPKYRAPIRVWQRLPRRLVNFIGPPIARNLG